MFLATDKGECVDVAFVAQGLEHWSCKPGVESSNLSEGFGNIYSQQFKRFGVYRCPLKNDLLSRKTSAEIILKVTLAWSRKLTSAG